VEALNPSAAAQRKELKPPIGFIFEGGGTAPDNNQTTRDTCSTGRLRFPRVEAT
jgi:hypothetical protein